MEEKLIKYINLTLLVIWIGLLMSLVVPIFIEQELLLEIVFNGAYFGGIIIIDIIVIVVIDCIKKNK